MTLKTLRIGNRQVKAKWLFAGNRWLLLFVVTIGKVTKVGAIATTGSRNGPLRLTQPGGHAHHERRTGHEDPVTDVDGSCVDPDKDLLVPDHGLLDGQTRRALKNALHAEAGRERPRVLLLRPGIERQRATSRGQQVFGFSPEDWYRRESFRDVMIVEDPDQKKLESILFSFEPDVVHIFSTMEESPSVRIYLDFGSRGSGDMPSRRVMKSAGP